MIKKAAVLGIDTSNYTTSAAIVDEDLNLVANIKRPLTVKAGERGLRQSDALFLHTVNIPDIMREASAYLGEYDIRAVGVSKRPRNIDGSYMPCFLAGVSSAESIASLMNIPLYAFSHQCGHIMAAIFSSGAYHLLSREFLAIHISGGTTEMLHCTPDPCGFKARIVGGAKDLNAGQAVDRIGVYLGMPFPAGPHLEQAALQNNLPIPKKKISLSDGYLNLSGLENMAIRIYGETGDVSLTAAFTFDYLGRAISAMLDYGCELCGRLPIVCAGGVMCNAIIKIMIGKDREIYFAEPRLSADNAVGIAGLALRSYKAEI